VGHKLLTEVWLSFVGRDLKNDITIGCSRVVCASKEIIKNLSALQSR
jgi:hypothetical protein